MLAPAKLTNEDFSQLLDFFELKLLVILEIKNEKKGALSRQGRREFL